MLRHQGFSITGGSYFLYSVVYMYPRAHVWTSQGFPITRGSYFLYMVVYMYSHAHVLTSGVINYKGFLLLHLHIRSSYLRVKSTSPSQGLLTWWLAWLPALLSYAFPMLFLRFYSLPGAMIPVPRFAVICRLAMRVIECVYFTGVPAHLYHKGFLPGG